MEIYTRTAPYSTVRTSAEMSETPTDEYDEWSDSGSDSDFKVRHLGLWPMAMSVEQRGPPHSSGGRTSEVVVVIINNQQ